MWEMNVYRRTFHADSILKEGFRDATGKYQTDQEYTGGWVSDCPLDEKGAHGDVLLVIEIPVDLFRRPEWLEEAKPYREAPIPAAILTALPKPRRVHE
jgi:hypothetical protein